MKGVNKISVLFILKKPGIRSHKGVLYVRTTVNGVRATEKSTFIKIAPEDWDQKNQKAKGNSPESNNVNDRLSDVRRLFWNAEKYIQYSGENITAKSLSDTALGRITEYMKKKEKIDDLISNIVINNEHLEVSLMWISKAKNHGLHEEGLTDVVKYLLKRVSALDKKITSLNLDTDIQDLT